MLPSHEEDRVDEGEQDADRGRRHDSDQAQILDINIAVAQKEGFLLKTEDTFYL